MLKLKIFTASSMAFLALLLAPAVTFAATFADAATALTGGSADVKDAGTAVLGIIIVVTVFAAVFAMVRRA